MIPDAYRHDPLTSATAAALNDLLARWYADDTWDQAPTLWLIVRHDDPSGVLAQGLIPLPLDGGVWVGHPAHRVLAVIAKATAMVGLPAGVPAGAQVVGVVMTCEAWGLRYDGLTPEQMRDAEQWARDHSLSEHPDRIEVKTVTAVDTAGFRYFVQHGRGEPRPDEIKVDVGDPRNHLHGRLTDGLTALLAAATAHA